MAGQSGNTPPPVLNLPWGHLRGGDVYLAVTALQFLQTLWAAAIPQPLLFATLPPNPANGQRGFITDSTVKAVGNFGTAATGGGNNNVPVYWDATAAAWIIG